MKEKLSAGDIIDQLVHRAGITKKLAAELLRAIPEVIEEGLIRDKEARVRGLGTFRLKVVGAKKGRNPKTGEEVVIPPHEKLVFLPEESFKEQANEEFRLLGIKVLEEEVSGQQSAVSGQDSGTWNAGKLEPDPVSGQQSEVSGQDSATWNAGTLEPEIVRKRRNYWLIPVIIVIVAALSVLFYWRNFRTSSQFAVHSSQEEVSGQRSAVSGQDSSTWNPEPQPVSGQRSAVSGQDSATWNSGTLEPNKQVPEPKPQNLNLNTNFPTTQIGTHLYQLAREAYGNPFLWVLIYRANLDKIKNPDLVVNGYELTIPALEGTPKKLTRNDSLNVSDGYRLVYEYYLSKGDTRAEEFRLVMVKYKPD